MKKYLISMMAAVAVVMTASSVTANASTTMPSPDKSPVERFISSFNRFFVLDYLIGDLDDEKDAEAKGVLEALETDAVTDVVSIFKEYGDYQLSAGELVQLANLFDVMADMVEGDKDARDVAALKSKVFSFETLGDVYEAIAAQSNSGAAADPDMNTYVFEDVTITYPDYYTLTDWETDYGWHFYFQSQHETATSVYMEIERLNLDSFKSYTTEDYADFLIDECKKYYDRYIDEDYKITWESEPKHYEDTNMAIISMSGIQYDVEFTGEILSLVYGNYQFTAFITGSDSEGEKEARDIFLSAVGSL